MSKKLSVVPVDGVERSIFWIREQKVMLDRDLAELYGVETRALIQAIKRNKERFPKDFMFQLKNQELTHLKSQNVMSRSWVIGGHTRAWGATGQVSVIIHLQSLF